MTRTNEKRETLIAFKNIDVKVKYFWDDHGKLINWDKLSGLSTEYIDAKVRIEDYSFTERASLLSKKDFTVRQLVINDKAIPGDTFDMDIQFGSDGKIILYCKVIVGAG